MSNPAPTLTLLLASRPQTLTLVRVMLAGIAESIALDAELLDDLKTAVSEAANNVVLHAYGEEPGPLEVLVFLLPDDIEVVVRDRGRGFSGDGAESEQAQGIGLPLMRALAREVSFTRREGGGTEVRMLFGGTRDGERLFTLAADVAVLDGFTAHLSGDAVASISPIGMLGAILGRLARVLAADARFSLDRFSDIYLVTDAIAAQAASRAATERIAFSLDGGERRLQISVGPFAPGTGEGLSAGAEPDAFPLTRLTDELAVDETEDGELLRATLVDPDPEPAT